MSDPRFRFRLSSVLRVAQLRKRLAEQKVAEDALIAGKAEREEQARIDAYQVHEDGVAPVTDMAGFTTRRQRGERLAESVKLAEADRRRAEAALTEARDKWLQEARKARSLERLEERHHAAHAMVAARAAQRALDDLVRIRRDDGRR